VVAQHADVRHHQGARHRAGDPDEGHEGLAEAKRQQIGRPVGQLDGPCYLQAAYADGQHGHVPHALGRLRLVDGLGRRGAVAGSAHARRIAAEERRALVIAVAATFHGAPQGLVDVPLREQRPPVLPVGGFGTGR